MFAFIDFFLSGDYKIRTLAIKLGAEFVSLKSVPSLVTTMQSQYRIFRQKANMRAPFFSEMNARAKVAYESINDSDTAIANMYDAEYGGEVGPHYAYLNSLLNVEGFEIITGIEACSVKQLRMVDIGAGSNELLRFLRDELLVPSENLVGTDISPASRDVIAKDGFAAYVGRTELLPIAPESYDASFLSYFVDYDTDQHATFESALKMTRSGGKVILEGLFPCTSFGLLPKDRETLKFVTKGESAAEDIELVALDFINIGESLGRKVEVERICIGERYVYSHFGLVQLPSYFLTLSV